MRISRTGRAAAALLALAVLLGGCARAREEAGIQEPGVRAGEAAPPSVEALDETPVTLRLYNTLGERVSAEKAEAYIHRTMPNVTVEYTYENGAKVENAQLAALKGGGGPDILYTQSYYNYVQSGYLLDLTAEPYLKNYTTSALSDIEVGGKVYALPVGNGYISGLLVNTRLLRELGYEMPQTREAFIRLCRQVQADREKTGVRAFALNMLYDASSALASIPFLIDAYTDGEYVQWLMKYRADPEAVSFDTPAFTRVLGGVDALKELDLSQSGDFLTNEITNMNEVVRGEALMCSLSYVTYIQQFEQRALDVEGAPSLRVGNGDGTVRYVPVSDCEFVPYRGTTPEDRWLATNGDWYLGINANITDASRLKACRLYLEYIASTEFAPEIYARSVPVGATTYYRRDDALRYDEYEKRYPEIYECLIENSVIKNPCQFYGSDVFAFALRHYLCGQKYYAGLQGASTYRAIDGVGDILSALEEFRTTGSSRYEVPNRVVGYTRKAYSYVRMYSRTNESALGNLLADALRASTGAQIAVVNAGSLTAGLKSGEITESDLATAMLYGLSNHVVTVRCKGENLLSILSSNNVAGVVRAEKEGVFGGLVIPSGFTYEMTYEPVEGQEGALKARVSDVRLLSGEAIDPEAYYTVTTTDYELGGIDQWHAFTLLTRDKPKALPEGIALYSAFDAQDEEKCAFFDLTVDNYDELYPQIADWAQNQPNIIEAVIRYIEETSEDGVLPPAVIDGRIRVAGPPERIDPAKNGVDLS